MCEVDRILEAIRAHPDGITTLEIVEALYPGSPGWRIGNLLATTHGRATKLARRGLATRTLERRPSRDGQHQVQAVWRPVS